MVRIVSDTSTLYSTAQAKEADFAVSPLSVTINGRTYREFDDISSEDFVAIIRQGHLPVSSQPAVGEVLELYEAAEGIVFSAELLGPAKDEPVLQVETYPCIVVKLKDLGMDVLFQ